MAVKDFFLDGTISTGATVTIQPASGTIYSFKRGSIFGDGGVTIEHRNAAQTWYAYNEIAANAGSATTVARSNFLTLVFSEAGVTGYAYSLAVPVIASTTPFTAISNGNYVRMVNGGSGGTAYYTLVGVSIT